MCIHTRGNQTMESNTNRGQVIIECIVVITFFMSILFYLNVHIEKSRKRILKHYPKTIFYRKYEYEKPRKQSQFQKSF
jgi:hypothetical protein